MEITRQQLCDALLDAFPTKSALSQMVFYGIDDLRSLDEISTAPNLKGDILALVQWAEGRKDGVAVVIEAARISNPGNEPIFTLAQRVGLAPTTPNLEQIIQETNDFIDIDTFLTRLEAIEKQVCKVEIASTSFRASGTGFLLGPDLVMTNYHVMERVIAQQGADSSDVTIRFDYKRLSDGTVFNPGTPFSLAANWLVASSPPSPFERGQSPAYAPAKPDELDFALLRLESRAAVDGRTWIEIPAKPPALAEGTPLFIVQHPEGAPLKLALDTDAVFGVFDDGLRIRYRTNTKPGSSGSPCFTADWQLVAIHHLGDPTFDPAEKPEYNQGVPLAKIVERLRQEGVYPFGARPMRLVASDPKPRLDPKPDVTAIAAELFAGTMFRIELSEERIAVAPGESATIQCIVTNTGDNVDTYQLAVTGIDPGLVDMPGSTDPIFPPTPDDVPSPPGMIPVTISVPHNATLPAGEHPFAITATSLKNPALVKAAECILVITPAVDFTLDMDDKAPVSNGLTADAVVRVRNAGNAPLKIDLSADETENQLDIEQAAQTITVPAGKQQAVRFTVGPREPKLGVTTVYELAITATGAAATGGNPGNVTRTATIPVRFALPTIDAPALDPRAVDLAGETGSTLLVLGNRAAFPIAVEMKGRDAAGALRFAFGNGNRVTLPPDSVQRVPVTIGLANPSPPAMIPFTLLVTPMQPMGGHVTAQGELRVTAPSNPTGEIEINLDPELVDLSGETAIFAIVLSNPGSRPATVKIELQDDARLYRVAFAEGALQHLAPGATVTVTMTLVCTDTSRLERGKKLNAINVAAVPVAPPGKPIFAKGLILVPSRRSQYMQLLLISVAVWFLGVVLRAVDALGIGGWWIAFAIPLGPIIGGVITKTWKFVSKIFLGLIALILLLFLIIIIVIFANT
jgi:hypothetical protein